MFVSLRWHDVEYQVVAPVEDIVALVSDMDSEWRGKYKRSSSFV